MPVRRRQKQQALIALIAIVFIIALDQITKSLVHLKLSVGESLPVIKNVLHITLVTNTGAAFGIFKNATPVFILISISAVIFVSVLIINIIKKASFFKNLRFDIALLLIISGALGNLIDRIRLGYVIDFIDVRIWPVFNIADTSITIGTCLLLLSFLKNTDSSAR